MKKQPWRICPKCNESYQSYPAISRDDNKTEVCEDCGTAEALQRARDAGFELGPTLREMLEEMESKWSYNKK